MTPQFSRVALALGLVLAAGAVHAADIKRPYIVQLADAPAATYTGGIANLPATQVAEGQRLNVNAAAVRDYVDYLHAKQDAVLGEVASVGDKIYSYGVVLNGFSALLTDDEVRALKANPSVLDVSPDQPVEMATTYTPSFLGLDLPDSLWQQLGGNKHAGEDIIVGVIDGGIWPENPAFSDKVDADGNAVVAADPNGTLAYGPPPSRWKGSCQEGEAFTAANCNNKLIGAKFFNESMKAGSPLGIDISDWNSPRDPGGHGTHTASTAAGNASVPVIINGVNTGKMSGMAPRARVAAYKICWNTKASPTAAVKNGCSSGDSVKAIEAAVSDGVDVINYSISGTTTDFRNPVEQAFLNAARAGVMGFAAAGNSGPANAANHPSPWLTTVAATTHDRYNEAEILLGDNTRLLGASLSQSALPNAPLILASAAGLEGADAEKVRLCYAEGVLDPAKVAGKIVVCDRGVIARVDKSAAVKAAGGVGMILLNVAENESLNDDAHSVPSVHLSLADATLLRAYMAANADASASLSKSAHVPGKKIAPVVDSYSSRGPNLGNANILKPDIAAPGSNIMAGYSPTLTQEQHDAITAGTLAPDYTFGAISGTSMATPHMSGLYAILKHKHPTWSPAALRSALMTTAKNTFADPAYTGTDMRRSELPWGQGAGFVQPNAASNPGLIYDLNDDDYTRFQCGVGALLASDARCKTLGSIKAWNLNLPSLTAADVMGKLTLERTVTHVGNSAATYSASASLPGFDVKITPATLTLEPGQKASYKVQLIRTTALSNQWSYGELVWNSGAVKVRSPLQAKPSMLVAPATFASEKANGTQLITVGTGFTGKMSVVKSGLLPAIRQSGTVTTAAGTADAACKANAAGTQSFEFDVAAGTSAIRLALFDTYTSGYQAGARDDLDLRLYNPAGTAVAVSQGISSNETVMLQKPVVGKYKACIVGYAPNGGSATYTLFSWLLKSGDDNGSLKVIAPAMAYTGGTATVNVSWKTASADKYAGLLEFRSDSGEVVGSTVIGVSSDAPVPGLSTGSEDSPTKTADLSRY